MNKLVYLHELDSVRNTPEEIKRGQEAMYHEIVVNGNIVVLTYNQFTDSKAFLCAVKNETQYRHILELFRKGYIKLSNFTLKEKIKDGNNIKEIETDIYTPSQYFQHSLEKNIRAKGTFIFSGLELNNSEKELMELMCNALKYSNTSVFDTYDVKAEEKERVDELIKYTRLLLAISVEELAYNPIKREKGLTLSGLMSEIMIANWSIYLTKDKAFAELFHKAIEVLKDVEGQLDEKKINARSNWIKKLNSLPEQEEVKLAAAIVHMAYNYVVEDSISNVSKHYDDTLGIDALLRDFTHRIEFFWEEHNKEGLHELHNPKNAATGNVWENILKWENFPEWETAARVTEEKRVITNEKEMDAHSNRHIYEDGYEQDRKKWRRKLGKTVLLQVLIAFVYIILIHIFNELTGGIQSIVETAIGLLGLDMHPVLSVIVNVVIYTVLLGIFSSYISNKLNLPDILESIDDIVNSFKDARNIRIAKRYASYVWLKECKVDEK